MDAATVSSQVEGLPFGQQKEKARSRATRLRKKEKPPASVGQSDGHWGKH